MSEILELNKSKSQILFTKQWVEKCSNFTCS
jgi:hypothetical protein